MHRQRVLFFNVKERRQWLQMQLKIYLPRKAFEGLQPKRTARAPLTLKSRFQTWNFPKRGIIGSSKDSRQNFNLRRNIQGKLSVEHSNFHLVWVGALLFLNPVHHITQD